ERLPRFQKGLLCEVLGRFDAPRQVAEQAGDAGVMLGDEPLPRRLIAVQDALHPPPVTPVRCHSSLAPNELEPAAAAVVHYKLHQGRLGFGRCGAYHRFHAGHDLRRGARRLAVWAETPVRAQRAAALTAACRTVPAADGAEPEAGLQQ